MKFGDKYLCLKTWGGAKEGEIYTLIGHMEGRPGWMHFKEVRGTHARKNFKLIQPEETK